VITQSGSKQKLEPVNANEWIDLMKFNYTTHEERQNHADFTGESMATQKNASADDDPTFF
jgi:hypothetical protein